MGALWRPHVLPYAEPCASAGGFERLLHEREGFEPETNRQLVCDKAFLQKHSMWYFFEARHIDL